MEKKVLNTDEVAKLLCCSRQKVNNLRKGPNPLPCHLCGNQPRYITDEVVQWLSNLPDKEKEKIKEKS